ncbi:MAG TPA: DEAD/DEAH box helicase [Methanoregula sp.]|nr:DEAD/DEAH box helicase [Methanoregula sp.]
MRAYPPPQKAITRRAPWSSTKNQSVFSDLHESLQAVLAERLGWQELREVQEQAYMAVRDGNDMLVLAPTAGGKSEAALIPVVDNLLKSGTKGVACLYLSPLKALINDQEERVAAFCRPTGLSVAKWHGDVPKGNRGWDADEAPQFLLITPESLEVLLHEKGHRGDLANLRYVIIDELHAFVETERGVHVKVLLDRLDKIARAPLQRIGLSATVGNPEEILEWLSAGSHPRRLVSVPAPATAKKFRFVLEPNPGRRISALARLVANKKALVFVNSRSLAETIVSEAAGRIKNLHIHHSSVPPAKKKQAEEAFHSGEGACIICTSTLELGIDIGDLDIVVQVGPPDSVSSFLQRMGRSGRRKQAAYVAWLLSDPNEILTSCAVIECAMEKRVEPLVPQEIPCNVLVQQIFLFVISASRAGRNTVVRELRAFPAFAHFSQKDIDRVLDYLVSAGFLVADGGMLMPGPEMERAFGRSNYKDLYSVISGGSEYRAVTPEGEEVGSLDARFANRSNPGNFTLGGETWSVVKCDDSHNLVVVVPGAHGGARSRVFWTAGEEAAMSPVICNAVQRIVARGGTVLPLGETENEALATALHNLPEGIGERGIFVHEEKRNGRKEVVAYSFAGSRFNRVLAHIVKGLLGRVEVRYDDYRVRVTRAGKTGAAEKVACAIREIPGHSLDEIAFFLPPVPTVSWKFAVAIPPGDFRAMVLADYYHAGDILHAVAKMPVNNLPKNETGATGMNEENKIPADSEDED